MTLWLAVFFVTASAILLHHVYSDGVSFRAFGVRFRSSSWDRPAVLALLAWLGLAWRFPRLWPTRNALVILVCLAAYASTLHAPYSSDVTPSAYTSLSIATGHGTSLDHYPELSERAMPYFLYSSPQGLRSGYPLGPALLAWPVFLPAPLSNLSRLELIDRLGSIAAMLMGLASVWFALKASERLEPPFSPRLVALAYGLGTTHWSTSAAALWQHGPGELWVLGALERLTATELTGRRRLFALGCCLTMAVATRPSLALSVVLILGLTCYFHGRKTGYAILAALALSIPVAAYHLDVYGSVLGPYVTQLHGFQLRAPGEWLTTVFWMVASPSRGMLWYEPVVIVTLVAASVRLVGRPSLLLAVGIAGFALMLAVYGNWVLWWGGHSFGPRLMTDALPWWVLGVSAMGKAGPWLRRATLGLVLCGGLVNVLEANGHPVMWDSRPPIEWFPDRLTSVGDSQLVTVALATLGGHNLTRQAVYADRHGQHEVALRLWSEEWRQHPWHRFAAFRVADLMLRTGRLSDCQAHVALMLAKWPGSSYARHLSQRLPAIGELLADRNWIRPVAASAIPNPGDAKKALDGRLETRWSTERQQQQGDWLEVELDPSYPVRGLALLSVPDFGEGPESLHVVGSDPSGRETVLLRELWPLAAMRKGWLVLRFPPQRLQSIRLSLLESRGASWSVSEVRLLRANQGGH